MIQDTTNINVSITINNLLLLSLCLLPFTTTHSLPLRSACYWYYIIVLIPTITIIILITILIIMLIIDITVIDALRRLGSYQPLSFPNLSLASSSCQGWGHNYDMQLRHATLQVAFSSCRSFSISPLRSSKFRADGALLG